MKKRSLIATLAATTVLTMMALLPSMFPGSASGAIDQPFSYAITANGTEDVSTYPNQEFTWTVTTTGTETWMEHRAHLGERYTWASGYEQYYTYYLYPAEGSTITSWSRTVFYSRYGGSDNGTYIDYANNRLVIEVYTGGSAYEWCCEWSTGWECVQWCSHSSPGSYAAMYHVYGDKPHTATLTATESGSGTVNATEGRKFISSFALAPLSPEHGGTVAVDSRTITDDNPNVTTEISVSTTGSVYGSTDYSETIAQPWSATEAGSASVNFSEGDKYITTSVLVAPNGDSTWSVADDSDYVDTWMDSSNLHARVTNLPPVADANGPYMGDEGSEITLDASGSSDPDNNLASYEWDLDNDGEYDDATGITTEVLFGDNGTFTVGLKVTDDLGESGTDTAEVMVSNVAPTVTLTGPNSADEGDTNSYSFTSSDPGDDTFSLVNQSCGANGILSNSSFDSTAGAGAFDCTFPDGPASSTVSVQVADSDGGNSNVDTITVSVANVAPTVNLDLATQDVQYSDVIHDVITTATDVLADPLTATTSWNVDAGAFTAGLPAGLALAANEASPCSGICTWTLSGIADVAEGTYIVRITVDDGDSGVTSVETTIVVDAEDATVAFDDDNQVAELVESPGGNSGVFSLTVQVTETEPDVALVAAAPGDIGLAVVSMTLAPVGPGGSATGTCTPDGVTGTGYDAELQVTCTFDNVPVNAYSVQVTVDGGYYAGSGEDVLVVYDPSLGFTTGGGWFYWPGTEDRTNFGFTMKYNKKGTKVQGSLLVIRHLSDGTIYRVKSNALYGLALGERRADAETCGWASFSGKATYLEPGWPEPVGNHEFVAYVEDCNEPGTGVDRFWIQVKDRNQVLVEAMSTEAGAIDNAEELTGGNIVAPHSPGGRKR